MKFECERCAKQCRTWLSDPTTMVTRTPRGVPPYQSPRMICLRCVDAIRSGGGGNDRAEAAQATRRVVGAVPGAELLRASQKREGQEVQEGCL